MRLTSFLPSGISTSVGAPIPGGFQGSFTFIFLLKLFTRLAVILRVMVPFLTSGTGGAKSSRWKGASLNNSDRNFFSMSDMVISLVVYIEMGNLLSEWPFKLCLWVFDFK